MDKKKITLTTIKHDLFVYIDEHAYLPDHLKSEAKILAADQFRVLSKMIGTMELAWRRGMDQRKEGTE